MADDLINQHKCMAMGEMPEVTGVESPWKSVGGEKGSRELSDRERKMPKDDPKVS